MSVWEAPAKVNLSLEVRPPDQTGKHPLRSLVQTVEWSDVLTLEEGDEDRLTVEGAAELADDGENLVWRAVSALRRATGRPRPLLDILLKKEVPVAAGLGGGSSDAAAALVALAEMTSTAGSVVTDLAPGLGSDVLLFLEGGLMWMEGYGERLTATQVDPRYALAIAVPNLELSTALVYKTWDRLDYPLGPSLPDRALPPTLRGLAPLRNDLTPAGLHLHPELGDFMTDLTGAWERPVAMSGSGPAVFGLFPDVDEAQEAAAAAPRGTRAARGVLPRNRGVARRPEV